MARVSTGVRRAATECRQGRRAGDPVRPRGPGSSGSGRGRPCRRAEVTVDVEQPEVARAREQELERRDVPPVRALHEHASRDEGPAERAELRARAGAELTGDRKPRQALERAQPLGGHRPRETVDLAEVHPLRAQRDLEARDLGIRRRRARVGAATRAAAIAASIKVAQTHGDGAVWGPASGLLQVFTNRQYFGVDVWCLRARFRSTAHLPVEGRGLKDDSRHFRADSRATVGAGSRRGPRTFGRRSKRRSRTVGGSSPRSRRTAPGELPRLDSNQQPSG